MKKVNLLLVLTLLIGVLVMPFSVKADDYKSLNLKDALAEEEIELQNSSYKETDDQAIIYMFRGKGCGYCKKFLTFLSSISKEYGKYFKLVSYEVWYEENNHTLMQTVASYLNKEAGGVPFIVIGDKVFEGYAEIYDEDIKSAIMNLYDTKKSDRYDVLKKIKDEGYTYTPSDNGTANNDADDDFVTVTSNESKKNKNNDMNIVILNAIFIAVATGIVIKYNSYRFDKLEEKIK